MQDVFFELYVQNEPKGGSTIFWGLRREFDDVGPYQFTVEWSETVEGEWELIPNGTVTDSYFVVDTIPRVFAKELESYYRVTLVTAKGTYVSQAVQATGIWDKRDWLKARDTIRREYLMMNKFTGNRAELYKRRIWGQNCPYCSDYSTQNPAQGGCPVCFGTGKFGGYWPPYAVQYWTQNEPQARNKTMLQNQEIGGVFDDMNIQVRMVAYPHLSSMDFIHNTSNGKRFIIRPVQTVAEIKGIPLVDMVELRLAPYTDPVYNVPKDFYNFSVPVVPTITSSKDSTDFVPMPERPLDPVVTEPTAPTVITLPPEVETVIDTKSQALWFTTEWYIGSVIGDATTASYSTRGATSNPFFIPKYDWYPTAGSGSVIFSTATNGFNVTSSDPSVTGVYTKAGTYNGMYVYVKAT